jgi:THAP4-like, heme-binding beta-barrel domain
VDPALHPDVEPLACLLGTWAGEGEGDYPTIDDFRYREEITFGHWGKPFLSYSQSTVLVERGIRAHGEVGYLRAAGPGRVEWVLVHPSGLAEVSEGDVAVQPDGLSLHLRSTIVTRTSTAKEVTTVERRVVVAGDVLRYELAMGAVGQPHQHHLSAELRRQSGD